MTTASLVIPSRGGAERLPRLMHALERQSNDDWEAVVVIDGDVDGSEAVMQQFAHLPVRAIVFPENRGRVAALNAGFGAATGEVLVRCDDDLEPAPDYVANHVSAHTGRSVGVVGIYRNVLTDNAYSRAFGAEADERFRRGAYAADADVRWLYWAGNCSITRDMWDAVGPYDTRYRAYGWEDVDYGIRLHRAGYPIVLDPSLETTHHAAAVTTESRIRRAYRSGQARRIFDAAHGSGIKGPGPSRPRNDSVWNVAVNALSYTLDYDRAGALAAAVDRWVLPRAPRPVSAKIVAMLVETAAVSGFASKESAHNDF